MNRSRISELFFSISSVLFLLFSSCIFIFFEQAHFDSDQAISGIMAKHLSELRHFPIFTYGAKYVLGFETWLAAPFMKLFSPSVATLKLPLLGLNLVSITLFTFLLKKEMKLSPFLIFLCISFFTIPNPITASRIIHAATGTPTTLLALLLVWIFWERPISLGILLGFVIPIRPFVLYGVFAKLILAWLKGNKLHKNQIRKLASPLVISISMIFLINWIGKFGPN